MKVKNISAAIVTLRSKKGTDIINPLEVVTILKENEDFAKLLIQDGKLKEMVVKTKPKPSTSDI